MLLPLWVAALAAGIAGAILCPPWLGGICAALAAVLGVWRLLARGPALGVAALALGAGVVFGQHALARARRSAGRPLGRVLASVIRGPEALDEGKARLWLEVDGATVALLVFGDVAARPGDLIACRIALRAPEGLANPGLPDARLAAAAKGIDLFATLGRGEAIEIVRAGAALHPRRIADRLRRALAAAIVDRVRGPPAALLRTVVLGERSGVGQAVEDGFRAAGATHVLSVSGLHLAAVAALVFFLIRRAAMLVPALALRVSAGRLAAAVALPAVALYTLVTGEAVATERSAVMAGMALAAGLVGRPFSLAAAIAAAALALIAEAPLVLLDISFQLTFASVIALALFAGRLAPARVDGAGLWRRLLGWLGRFGAASLAASLATGPLVAHHFGELTPAAPLGNLALVPLIELAMLPLSLGGALLALIHPVLGAPFLSLAGWAAALALWLAELFRQWAPVVLVRFPNVLETAALVGAGAAALHALGTRRRAWMVVALAGGLVGAGSLVGRDVARRTSRAVRVTFLDVGQGDAAVVEGPRGFVAVIDGGGTYDDSFDPGARVVEPYLRARGIPRVDLMVLSHPHPDHLNGLLRILGRFEVGTLWTSGDDGHNPRYRELLALATRRGVAAPTPAPLARDGLALVPVGPWVGDRIAAPEGATVNDASLVVRLEYAGRSALFSGDVEENGEGELAGRAGLGVVLASDVLKVPHHGSRTSSSDELLDAVRPRLAVISLGRQNHFGFPRAEVLARYRQRGIRLLRTDEVGAVTLMLDGALGTTCARGCR